MKFARSTTAVVASIAALALATPALAGSTNLTDPEGDVLRDYYGYAEQGYFDGDITAAKISYSTSTLKITTTFAEFYSDSWNLGGVSIDTNADGKSDYSIVSADDHPDAGSGDIVVREKDSKKVGTPTVTRTYGTPGTVTFSVKTSDIGSPKSIRAQIIFGYEAYDGTYFNIDAIPQKSDGSLKWSSSVSKSSSTSATKAVKTKTSLKLSKSSQVKGKSAVKATVTVSPKSVKGKVVILDGNKKLKTITVKNGKASYTFKKSLKVGTHRISAEFVPSDTKKAKSSSSKTVKLTVKKG